MSTDAAMMTNGVLSPPPSDQHPTPRAHVDVNDPIYQAMMAAAKSRPAHKSSVPDTGITPPHTTLSPLQSPTYTGGLPPPPARGAGGPSAVPPAKKAKALAAFGAEEEEDQPKRRLIPLQYRCVEFIWTLKHNLPQVCPCLAAAFNVDGNMRSMKSLAALWPVQ